MATQTPNLGLTLPVGGENVSRQIINQNMTLIDQYCGAINQSTYRLVPFTLAVNDWVSSGGQWVVNFLTAYVTASSDEIITFGSSLTNAQAHIIAEKKSGGGGVVFTTATKPTGAIQGMMRIFDNDDHKIPILVEGTVTPIANGGTGQSTLSGAQQALGITALSNQIGSFRFAVLTGTTNNSDTALSIDLPSGFTKDNCLVVAYGIDADNVWRNAGGGYNPNDFSSYGSVCALKTNENKITLSAIGTVVRNRPYKIILCRYI